MEITFRLDKDGEIFGEITFPTGPNGELADTAFNSLIRFSQMGFTLVLLPAPTTPWEI